MTDIRKHIDKINPQANDSIFSETDIEDLISKYDSKTSNQNDSFSDIDLDLPLPLPATSSPIKTPIEVIQNDSPDEVDLDISLPPPVPTTRRSSSESYKRDKFHSPNEDQDDNSSRISTVSSIQLINAIVTDVIEKNDRDIL